MAAVVIVDDGPYIDDDINEFSGQVTDELLCCCCPLYEIIDDDDDCAGGWQKFGKRYDPIIGETDDDVPSFDDMAVVDVEIIVRCLSDDDEHKSTFWCGWLTTAGLLWWTTAEDGIIIDELWSLMLAFFTEINCLALNAEYAWLVVVIIGSNKPG